MMILCPNGTDCTNETIGVWWMHRLRHILMAALRPAQPAITARARGCRWAIGDIAYGGGAIWRCREER